MERLLDQVGENAAFAARHEHTIEDIARGLGLPEKDAHARLHSHGSW